MDYEKRIRQAFEDIEHIDPIDLELELHDFFIEEMGWNTNLDKYVAIPYQDVLKEIVKAKRGFEKDVSLEEIVYEIKTMYSRHIKNIFWYFLPSSTHDFMSALSMYITLPSNQIKDRIRRQYEDEDVQVFSKRETEWIIEMITKEELDAIRLLIEIYDLLISHPDVKIYTDY